LQGADVLRDIIEKYFGHRIKRYILGQTLTSEAEATGLGSGVADLHLATFMDIVRYDTANLAETLTTDLVQPLKEWNFPEAANVHVEFQIETETPEADKRLQAYAAAWQIGARIKEEDVLKAVGAALPTEQDRVLTNPALAMAGAGTGGQDTHPVTAGINAHHAAAPVDGDAGESPEMSEDERIARQWVGAD
jgi:phage gp29-like protein